MDCNLFDDVNIFKMWGVLGVVMEMLIGGERFLLIIMGEFGNVFLGILEVWGRLGKLVYWLYVLFDCNRWFLICVGLGISWVKVEVMV